jgi:hypothetical protein
VDQTAEAVINHKSLNKISECTLSSGYIGIQAEGTEIEIRQIFVEPVKN